MNCWTVHVDSFMLHDSHNIDAQPLTGHFFFGEQVSRFFWHVLPSWVFSFQLWQFLHFEKCIPSEGQTWLSLLKLHQPPSGGHSGGVLAGACTSSSYTSVQGMVSSLSRIVRCVPPFFFAVIFLVILIPTSFGFLAHVHFILIWPRRFLGSFPVSWKPGSIFNIQHYIKIQHDEDWDSFKTSLVQWSTLVFEIEARLVPGLSLVIWAWKWGSRVECRYATSELGWTNIWRSVSRKDEVWISVVLNALEHSGPALPPYLQISPGQWSHILF